MKAALQIDHLVVTAPNLKSGVQWVRDALGATPQLGGKHVRMGTHNCLLRLGEKTYLEVISPDPNAPRPQRPRWFELDELRSSDLPRLAAWVARTTDIRALIGDGLRTHSDIGFGTIESMSRGDLNWLISVSADGSLPLGGAAPVLIEWCAASHPAQMLRNEGCRLLELELQHPAPQRVEALLESITLESPEVRITVVHGASVALLAAIDTPRGVKRLPPQ